MVAAHKRQGRFTWSAHCNLRTELHNARHEMTWHEPQTYLRPQLFSLYLCACVCVFVFLVFLVCSCGHLLLSNRCAMASGLIMNTSGGWVRSNLKHKWKRKSKPVVLLVVLSVYLLVFSVAQSQHALSLVYILSALFVTTLASIAASMHT